MIFYFTGTGNSLYVAKEMGDQLLSIPQVIGNTNQDYADERIGIVCPVYGHEVPTMVKEFVKKAQFHTDYFYMILTYGRIHGGARELAERMLEEAGKKANYINVIVMVDNFLPGFDMNEQRAIDGEKQVDIHIQEIKQDIENKKEWFSPVSQDDRDWHQSYLERTSKMPAGAFSQIYRITEDCIGCGICTKVCPRGCFSVESQKAVWNPDGCELCMSCTHNCPEMAIKLNMPEKNPEARYRNEHISLQEIIESNNQKTEE